MNFDQVSTVLLSEQPTSIMIEFQDRKVLEAVWMKTQPGFHFTTGDIVQLEKCLKAYRPFDEAKIHVTYQTDRTVVTYGSVVGRIKVTPSIIRLTSSSVQIQQDGSIWAWTAVNGSRQLDRTDRSVSGEEAVVTLARSNPLNVTHGKPLIRAVEALLFSTVLH